ncbi:MAG: RNA polymerase subunit sigma-70, partial [Bacteroidetes bacterium]|nr:RNA polymerase subunit sigma-70 [Bacteroidota bacterium]
EIMAMVNSLTPSYRAVFNLYVVEGYTHPEIAKLLEINEGTSKSNLAKAKVKLRKMIEQNRIVKTDEYGRESQR